MTRPQLLIAERNSELRTRMLQASVEAGYRVKTAGTVAQLLCQVLRKQGPVVLLGDNFEESLPLADLIRLMKTCNPHLAIILVSDAISLLQVRKARQLGIFYHALQPDSPAEWQELEEAVSCAFRSSRPDANVDRKTQPPEFDLARELH
jgi:DNA-binding NtrC family response regulator